MPTVRYPAWSKEPSVKVTASRGVIEFVNGVAVGVSVLDAIRLGGIAGYTVEPDAPPSPPEVPPAVPEPTPEPVVEPPADPTPEPTATPPEPAVEIVVEPQEVSEPPVSPPARKQRGGRG